MNGLLTLGLLLPVFCNYVTLQTRFSADPSPLVVGQRLYVYTTHDEVNVHCFCMQDYNVISTVDGVNWRDDGIAFSPVHNTTWAHNAWAQQVIWHEPLQRYLMYFPGMGSPSVGVAYATDPRGPFVDYAMQAIAPGEDPTIFVDDDGTPYLCTATNQPYNMPFCGILNADMKSWKVNQSQVFINGLKPGDFFEAPWLFKYEGLYYLSFMQGACTRACVCVFVLGERRHHCSLSYTSIPLLACTTLRPRARARRFFLWGIRWCPLWLVTRVRDK